MNVKSLVAGILIGTVVSTSVSAFGLVYASGKVEAWIQTKQVRVIVDGQYPAVPEDMQILNYNNRIYTPARFIAENLGATVDWEEARQAVIIQSKEPEVVEKEVEKSKDEDKVENKKYYSQLPLKRNLKDVIISVNSIRFYAQSATVKIELTNDSQYPIMFYEDRTYLEADGKRYALKFGDNQLFSGNTINANTSLKSYELVFELPPEDIDDITLHIPVKIYNGVYTDDEGKMLNFEFSFDAEEDRKE